MTKEEREIVEEMVERKRVPPRTYVGRGHVVAWCVRRGWLEWERNSTRNTNATALVITPKGIAAIRQATG